MTQERFLSVFKTAHYFNVDQSTVHRWIVRGWLKCVELEGFSRIISMTEIKRFETDVLPTLRRGPKGPRKVMQQ